MSHNWLHRKDKKKPGVEFADPNLQFVLGHFKKGRVDDAFKWLRRQGISVQPTPVPGTDDTFTCTTSNNDELANELREVGAEIVWQQLVYGRRPGDFYPSPMHYRICMRLPLPPAKEPQPAARSRTTIANAVPSKPAVPAAPVVVEPRQAEVAILPPPPKIRILQVSDSMLLIEPTEDGATVKLVIPGTARDGTYIPDKVAAIGLSREQVQELHAALSNLL